MRRKRMKEHKRLGESSMWLRFLTARVEKRACRSRKEVFAAVRQHFSQPKIALAFFFRGRWKKVGFLDKLSVYSMILAMFFGEEVGVFFASATGKGSSTCPHLNK